MNQFQVQIADLTNKLVDDVLEALKSTTLADLFEEKIDLCDLVRASGGKATIRDLASAAYRSGKELHLRDLAATDATLPENPAVYFEKGLYIVEVLRAFTMKTRKGSTFAIVDCLIIDSTNLARPAGSKASWVVDLRQDASLGVVRSFLAATGGVDPSDEDRVQAEVTEDVAAFAFSDANPLAGVRLGLECVEVKTKTGEIFLKHYWEPFPKPEKAKRAKGKALHAVRKPLPTRPPLASRKKTNSVVKKPRKEKVTVVHVNTKTGRVTKKTKRVPELLTHRQQILSYFLRHPKASMTLADLAKKIGSEPQNIKNVVKSLVGEGVLRRWRTADGVALYVGR